MTTTAMTVHEDQNEGLTMVASPREAQARLIQLQQFVKGVMVKGSDYGQIPGVEKNVLFKPGAEKLAEIYGLAPAYTFETKTEDWDKLFFYYQLRCTLNRGDRVVAEGLGSCNSREDKYAWRWLWDNEVPKGMDTSSLKQKTGTGKGGRKWTKFRVPNEDLASVVNTILKMACKRAFVAAVISATRSSDLFTQDVEDMPGFAADDDADPAAPPDHFAALVTELRAATLDGLGKIKKSIAWHRQKGNLTDEQYTELVALGKSRHAQLDPAVPGDDSPEPGSEG
jgi:hypothetical protein